MKIVALCHTCRHQHPIDIDPRVGPGNQFSDWLVKHHGHITGFDYPRRRQREMKSSPVHSWEGYIHNANVKVVYAASAAPTMTLASLAASSTLLAGRESSAVTNASNLYLDYMVAGNYKSAASNNQAGTIYTCIVGARDDTPTWPDVFDGTDSTETVSKAGVFNSICKILSTIGADNTASQTWSFGPASLASLFGGTPPVQFVYFVTQSIQTSTNAWSATEGDHSIKHTPVYASVA